MSSKYIAFDLGNVIFDLDFKEFWQIISELDANVEDVEHYLRLIERQEFCGSATMRDYLEDAFSPEEAEMLSRSWNDVIKENKYMTEFLIDLKNKNFNIAFISNMGIGEIDYARTKFKHIFELADVQHISCEVGTAKPSLLYYQSFYLQNPRYSDCIYVDDREENILTGTKCGLKSIKFDLSKFFGTKPDLTNIKKAIYSRYFIGGEDYYESNKKL